MRTATVCVALITFALPPIGCEREDSIRTYQAPKEQPPQQPEQPAPKMWQVPDGWVEGPPGQMRIATYRTSTDPDAAELVITRFPVDGFGGMLANINRWRGMVGLEPIQDEKQQPVQTIKIGETDGSIFDLTGPTKEGRARRAIIAMVPVGDVVWFFRFIGNANVVEQHNAELHEFLQSVRFED